MEILTPTQPPEMRNHEDLADIVRALQAFSIGVDIGGQNDLVETACCGSCVPFCFFCFLCGFCFSCS